MDSRQKKVDQVGFWAGCLLFLAIFLWINIPFGGASATTQSPDVSGMIKHVKFYSQWCGENRERKCKRLVQLHIPLKSNKSLLLEVLELHGFVIQHTDGIETENDREKYIASVKFRAFPELGRHILDEDGKFTIELFFEDSLLVDTSWNIVLGGATYSENGVK